jgi:TatD DNase family protein
MRLLDAHVHLDRYMDTRLDDVLGELERLEIVALTNAVDLHSWQRVTEIAERCPQAIPGFGIHPWEAPLYTDPDRYAAVLDEAPFIGEIGLDRRFVKESENYPAQRSVFEHHLEVASATGKMVNVHTTGAERESLEFLRRHAVERVIIHWYQGPIDVLRDMIAEGFYFTLGVEVTLSDRAREVAAMVPDAQLLTETDNPGGAEWLTGKAEMPSLLQRITEELASVRNTTPEAITETVLGNFRRLVEDDPHFEPWAALIAG